MNGSVGQSWRVLRDERADEYGYVRIRLFPECPHALYAALHRPNDMPAIMLELGTASLPARLRFPDTVGLRVHAHPVSPGPHGLTRIIVELTRAIYRDVFEVLADDVCRQIPQSASESEAAESLVARLSRWQTFLRKYAPDGLTPEQQAGLFGELWFLRTWLLDGVGAPDAVASWKGPEAAAQDFQMGTVAVEVKVTRGAGPEKLPISNVRQLDDTGLAHLLLQHVSFDVRQGPGQTLPWLVAAIENRLEEQNAGAAEEFRTKLALAGYLSTQAELYSDTTYALRRHCFYRVAEGFPRLVEGDLPSGIGDVSYSIAVDALQAFSLADTSVRDLLLGAFNG